MTEAFDAFCAEFRQAPDHTFVVLRVVDAGLGEELVGITNYLLFQGLGQPTGQSGTRVALGNSGVAGKALLTQHLPSYLPVTEIGFCAKALDAGSIAPDDADVVKHGGLEDEVLVEIEFGMGLTDSKCQVCHLTAVTEQDVLQLRLPSIIFVDECLGVHGISIFLPCLMYMPLGNDEVNLRPARSYNSEL